MQLGIIKPPKSHEKGQSRSDFDLETIKNTEDYNNFMKAKLAESSDKYRESDSIQQRLILQRDSENGTDLFQSSGRKNKTNEEGYSDLEPVEELKNGGQRASLKVHSNQMEIEEPKSRT